MVKKERQCKNCNKLVMFSGRVCDKCKLKLAKIKEKLEAKKVKTKENKLKQKEIKRVSIKNLQILHQLFVRLCYPNICCSCSKEVTKDRGLNQSQGGHLFSKKRYGSIALFVCNIYCQCAKCNSPMIGDGEPILLYKFGLFFWGEDCMEFLLTTRNIKYAYNIEDKNEIFNFISDRIKLVVNCANQEEKKVFLRETWLLQKEMVFYKNILENNQKKEN